MLKTTTLYEKRLVKEMHEQYNVGTTKFAL